MSLLLVWIHIFGYTSQYVTEVWNAKNIPTLGQFTLYVLQF